MIQSALKRVPVPSGSGVTECKYGVLQAADSHHLSVNECLQRPAAWLSIHGNRVAQ